MELNGYPNIKYWPKYSLYISLARKLNRKQQKIREERLQNMKFEETLINSGQIFDNFFPGLSVRIKKQTI